MEGHHVERGIILKMNLEMWWEGVDYIRLDQDKGCVTETCLCGNETSSATEVCAIC
jgi:esterase/lipase